MSSSDTAGSFAWLGKPTERIWCYDLSERKVGKKTPLTLADFADFFEKLPDRAESDKS